MLREKAKKLGKDIKDRDEQLKGLQGSLAEKDEAMDNFSYGNIVQGVSDSITIPLSELKKLTKHGVDSTLKGERDPEKRKALQDELSLRNKKTKSKNG